MNKKIYIKLNLFSNNEKNKEQKLKELWESMIKLKIWEWNDFYLKCFQEYFSLKKQTFTTKILLKKNYINKILINIMKKFLKDNLNNYTNFYLFIEQYIDKWIELWIDLLKSSEISISNYVNIYNNKKKYEE